MKASNMHVYYSRVSITRITRGGKEIVRVKEKFELKRFAKFANAHHYSKTHRIEINLT